MMNALIPLGKLLFSLKKNKIKKADRILIFKIGAIGDVVMTTPLIRAIRTEFPHARIDYLIGKSYASILEGNPYIDNIITFDENIYFRRKLMNIFNAIRIPQKYDLAFVLDKHMMFPVLASRFAHFRVGFDRNGEGFANNVNVKYENYTSKSKHEIYYYLDTINAISKKEYTDAETNVFLSGRDEQFAKEYLKKHHIDPLKLVCICPGGAINLGVGDDYMRRWPLDRFIQLAKRLLEKDYYVMFLGGKEDAFVEKENIKHKNFHVLIGKTTIKQTAAVLKQANVVICNDSGPMHLAGAVNRNILSLFGPTSPIEKAPLQSESSYIWKEKMQAYDIYGKCNTKENLMKKIEVKDVLECLKMYGIK